MATTGVRPRVRELLRHARQQVARIAVERPAIGFVHGDLCLADAVIQPGHIDQRAGNGHAGPVRVALVEAQAGFLHRAAGHIDGEHRSGQQHSGAERCRRAGQVQALAAIHAIEVVQQQIQEAQRGSGGEKGFQLLRHLRSPCNATV